MDISTLQFIVLEDGNWIRKEAGIQRWISEKLFGSYREQMENLRLIDDQIKEWTADLEKIHKNAKAAQSKGRPLDVLFWLSEINKRLKLVVNHGKGVTDLSEQQIDELFGEGEQGVLEDYFGEPDPNKLALAGVLDNIGDRLAKWKLESLYRKRLQAQKLALQHLMRLADSTLVAVTNSLRLMNKARRSGNIQDYINNLSKIANTQSVFEKNFKAVSEKNFQTMVERIRQRQKAQEKAQPAAEAIPATVDMPAPPAMVSVGPSIRSLPVEQPQSTQKSLQVPDLLPTKRQLPSIFEDGVESTLVSSQPKTQPKTQPAGPLPEPVPSFQLTPPSPESLAPQPGSTKIPAPNTLPGQTDLDFTTKPENVVEIEGVTPDDTIQGEVAAEMTEMGQPPAPVSTTEPKVEEPKKKRTSKPKRKPKTAGSSLLLQYQHKKFYQALEKAATLNDPYVVANMLLAYSEKIDEDDPEISAKLLRVAESILNG